MTVYYFQIFSKIIRLEFVIKVDLYGHSFKVKQTSIQSDIFQAIALALQNNQNHIFIDEFLKFVWHHVRTFQKLSFEVFAYSAKAFSKNANGWTNQCYNLSENFQGVDAA